MPIKLANNASGTTATAISASDTGLVLTTGDGAEFPTLGAGDYFYATVTSSGGTFEIVKATARSGDSLTVVRAQESTTAQSFAAGSRFELRVTAASVNDRADLAESEANTYALGLDTTLRANLAASSGSSLVGFLQAGTSAVTRTAQSKMRDSVSVKDFGAVGDGVTDDTAAIQAAIDYATANRTSLYFPATTMYLVNSTLYLPDQVSNPDSALYLHGDSAPSVTTLGKNTGTSIFTTASVMFASKTTPSGSGFLPNVSVSISGIQFRTNYLSNPTAICFNNIGLYGSQITSCGFYGFDTWLYGSMSYLCNISKSHMGVRRLIKPNPAYSNVCVDSIIDSNYINGLGGTPAGIYAEPVIDIQSAARMTISNNYIDYAYIGIDAGSANEQNIIKNNVFDICYRAIQINFGLASLLIDGNTFLRIAKTAVTYFNFPLPGMATNNWVCILMPDERLANIVITNNNYFDADDFFKLGTRGIWNVRETNNIGTYDVDGVPAPANAVNFGTRNIDNVAYPLDNTLLYFGSLEDQLNASIRTKRFAYVGLSYYLGSPPVRVRVNSDYSLSGMNGEYSLGKTNLLPATDFASGWTFATNVSQVGGVFTAANGDGWSYTNTVLSPGTYIMFLDIAALSSGNIEAGWSATGTPGTYVTSGISTFGLVAGSPVNVATKCQYQLNVTTTTARIGIFVASGTTGTIDEIILVKVA
jgi:hypothetical protein